MRSIQAITFFYGILTLMLYSHFIPQKDISKQAAISVSHFHLISGLWQQ